MKLSAKLLVFLSLLLLAFSHNHIPAVAAGGAAPSQDTVLKAADITAKIFPEHVFFRGQVAPAQLRNTGGAHFADDLYVLAGLVDSSGYSASIKEKYQAYLLSELALEIGGQTLKPAAYGFGFVSGKFALMDLAANDLIEATGPHDAELKRPIPLQVAASSTEGRYRLYIGPRFHRIPPRRLISEAFQNRHRGSGRPPSPATAPGLRVRIRRFGGLS